MPLSVGDRLGHYNVTALIGEGGMGQVYRATDTKLARDVALKILPDAFAADPDRLARFQREAQVLASLNHPGIAAIYGTEEDTADGTRALVLELVEGPTLADRIAEGAMPIEDALPIAKQIAEALEAAHEAGVIHRDLKPANIKVREDGSVKVLDFGLAKAFDTTPQSDPSQSPTLTAAATQIGVIMGTAAYMSPEQARGKPADRRSDLWALGAVLFEMLSATRPFGGTDVSEVLAGVIKSEPDWTLLPGETPDRWRQVIRRCLEKDPRQRLRDAGDLRLALHGAFETPARPSADRAAAPARSPLRFASALAAAGVLGVALGMVVAPDGGSTPGPAAAVHFGLALPGVDIVSARPSPDGGRLALVGRDEAATGNQTRVWIRDLDDTRSVAVETVEGFRGDLAWSPDGTELALGTTRGVVAVGIETGLRRSLSDEPFRVQAWRAGATILDGGIAEMRGLDVRTGEVRALGAGLHLSPSFLPDGRRFLFTGLADAQALGNPTGIYLSSIDAPDERRLVLPVVSTAIYAEDHLLFVRDGTLFAQPFDSAEGVVSGQPAALVDGVRFFQPNGAARFDVAGDTLTYMTPRPDHTPIWVDRRGETVGTLGVPGLYQDVAIAPDGERVLLYRVDRRSGGGDLWLHDLERNTEIRLTNDAWSEILAIWSPDGRHVAYGWDGEGPPDVYVKEVDSDAPAMAVYQTPAVDFPVAWLPDGGLLVRSGGTLAVVALDGTAGDDVALPETANLAADLSPDGQWIAFMARDTGRQEVYVQPFGRRGGRVRVSSAGGLRPRWSRDGRSLYYLRERSLYATDVRLGATFEHDAPEVLFSADRQIDFYDVLPDGERALVILDASNDFQRVQVLTNWQARLP